MDFFEHQEAARKKTRLLVISFILSIVAIAAIVYFVACSIAGPRVREYYEPLTEADRAEIKQLLSRMDRDLERLRAEGPQKENLSEAELADKIGRMPAYFVLLPAKMQGKRFETISQWWNPNLLLWSSLGTLSFVLLGSAYKTRQLKAGGKVIARILDGRRVDPSSTDVNEARLINIVEEMSIASGIPVPEVYVMDREEGINSFAAGHDPVDAVIGFTRGAMKLLTRDELQGVVAHEYSHILNGDMRLNLRLVGLLHGILVIAIFGQMNVRAYAERHPAGVLFVVPGLFLWLLGSVGYFLGKIMKASVSRQREFLADASAVQFTRNPDGIAGALKKIGGLDRGSRIRHSRAEEASHMFFADGIKRRMSGLLSTHPPLKERILRLLPSWNGVFPKLEFPKVVRAQREISAARTKLEHRLYRRSGAETPGSSSEEAHRMLGHLEPEQVEAARAIHAELPPELLDVARHETGAQSVIFAMALSRDEALRAKELAILKDADDEATVEETQRVHELIRHLDGSGKMAVTDLCIPALRRLTRREFDRFADILDELIKSDERVTLFESMLSKVVLRHLDLYFRGTRILRAKHHSLGRLVDEVSMLLSVLARLGREEAREDAEEAFRAGAAELEKSLGGRDLTFRELETEWRHHLDEALDRLGETTPVAKRSLLSGCIRAVTVDGRVSSEEADLVRTVADAIGVPLPPFVARGAAN